MPPEALNLEALKVLIGAFGGSGFAFFISWFLFRSWKEALAKKDTIMESRIEALERATAECAKDRRELHQQMFELQKATISANTEILHKVASQLTA